MASLTERLINASFDKNAVSTLDESSSVDRDLIDTGIPILNVAYSGSINGGFGSGLTTIAGPSRHFKSLLGLIFVSAYLRKYPDGICVFYDSEFGSSREYFESIGIDTSRVLHIPIKNIEELKFDAIKKLEEISKDDHVIFFVDSVGNLASKKEIEDAIDEKSVADMTRAKQMKSFGRMVTPYLSINDIPMIVIAHTYKEMGMFPKDVVAGGTGIMYSSQTVFIMGRQQEKDGKEVVGYNFILNIDKSRFVREKSKLTLTVTYEGGINKFSGLLDLAMEVGFVEKTGPGFYTRKTVENDKKWRAKQTNCEEFWEPILSNPEFNDAVVAR
ncbi:MAG: recombinase RecA, partial [Methanobacteriota archaeon]